MTLEQQIQKFKFDVLKKMPFYGDILMRLNIVEDYAIKTASTNGLIIKYNPKFMSQLTVGECNYVLMHEVFHVLLMHCQRNPGKDRDLWNVACDMVVNSMLNSIARDMKSKKIAFEAPKDGIFVNVADNDTVENIYMRLEGLVKNGQENKNGSAMTQTSKMYRLLSVRPDDLIIASETDEVTREIMGIDEQSMESSESIVLSIIREATEKNRSNMGSYFVPDSVYNLTESKKLPWQKLLKNFLSQEISDEVSYTTPERKYIHMDLIIPGHSLSEEILEEVWAFVDSSGSIGKNEMEQFLTQLYRISKEFKCKLNICYWDTQVTDVYKNILKESDILKCLPTHSGGTSVNCVYDWLKANKVKPDVMLILTDGYFGNVSDYNFLSKLRKKTIVVLSSNIAISDEMNRMGKITRL